MYFFYKEVFYFDHSLEIGHRSIYTLQKIISYQTKEKILQLEVHYYTDSGEIVTTSPCGTKFGEILPKSVEKVQISFSRDDQIETIYSACAGDFITFLKFSMLSHEIKTIGNEVFIADSIAQQSDLSGTTIIQFLKGCFRSRFFFLIIENENEDYYLSSLQFIKKENFDE